MFESMFLIILAIAIFRIVFPIVATIIVCSNRPKGRRPSAAKATGTAQNYRPAASTARNSAHDADEIAYRANEQAWLLQEQARLANEQAMEAHMQAVQQHQQFIDQVNRQQFDQFSWQSMTPIDQGGFVPTSTSTGMF